MQVTYTLLMYLKPSIVDTDGAVMLLCSRVITHKPVLVCYHTKKSDSTPVKLVFA